MKEFAKKFYQSKQWQKCRKAYIAQREAIDGGLCERCYNRYGYIVHHKIWLTPHNIINPDIALNYKYLEYLCHQCHDDEHLYKTKLRVKFNKDGSVSPL